MIPAENKQLKANDKLRCVLGRVNGVINSGARRLKMTIREEFETFEITEHRVLIKYGSTGLVLDKWDSMNIDIYKSIWLAPPTN